MFRQDPMHRRNGDRDPMKPVQVRRNPASAEVIVLTQIENFADDLLRGGPRRSPRRPRSVAQAGIPVLGVASLPFVEGFPGQPESPAHPRDILLVRRVL
jgi:hypothetical protein